MFEISYLITFAALPQKKLKEIQRQALSQQTKRFNRPAQTSRSPRLTVQKKVKKTRKVPSKHARTTRWCLYRLACLRRQKIKDTQVQHTYCKPLTSAKAQEGPQKAQHKITQLLLKSCRRGTSLCKTFSQSQCWILQVFVPRLLPSRVPICNFCSLVWSWHSSHLLLASLFFHSVVALLLPLGRRTLASLFFSPRTWSTSSPVQLPQRSCRWLDRWQANPRPLAEAPHPLSLTFGVSIKVRNITSSVHVLLRLQFWFQQPCILVRSGPCCFLKTLAFSVTLCSCHHIALMNTNLLYPLSSHAFLAKTAMIPATSDGPRKQVSDSPTFSKGRCGSPGATQVHRTTGS